MNNTLTLAIISIGKSFWLFFLFLTTNVVSAYINPLSTSDNQSIGNNMTESSFLAGEIDQHEEREGIQIVFGKKGEILFHPIIIQAANRYQVDSSLVKAIIMAESSYNPKAISEVGAQGLMQLMPRTAKELGVQDSFNPEQNIDAGVRYIKILLNQFDGNLEFALAAYNAGCGNVRKYRGIPPYKATHIYVKKVRKYYKTYHRAGNVRNQAALKTDGDSV